MSLDDAAGNRSALTAERFVADPLVGPAGWCVVFRNWSGLPKHPDSIGEE